MTSGMDLWLPPDPECLSFSQGLSVFLVCLDTSLSFVYDSKKNPGALIYWKNRGSASFLRVSEMRMHTGTFSLHSGQHEGLLWIVSSGGHEGQELRTLGQNLRRIPRSPCSLPNSPFTVCIPGLINESGEEEEGSPSWPLGWRSLACLGLHTSLPCTVQTTTTLVCWGCPPRAQRETEGTLTEHLFREFKERLSIRV